MLRLIAPILAPARKLRPAAHAGGELNRIYIKQVEQVEQSHLHLHAPPGNVRPNAQDHLRHHSGVRRTLLLERAREQHHGDMILAGLFGSMAYDGSSPANSTIGVSVASGKFTQTGRQSIGDALVDRLGGINRMPMIGGPAPLLRASTHFPRG